MRSLKQTQNEVALTEDEVADARRFVHPDATLARLFAARVGAWQYCALGLKGPCRRGRGGHLELAVRAAAGALEHQYVVRVAVVVREHGLQ